MNMRSEQDTMDIVLTKEGRRLLAERARELNDVVIPGLLEALEDRQRDGRVDAELEQVTDELPWIRYLLEAARAAEELPSDPDIVELGDTVTIWVDGLTERYMIVHPVEAPLDELRISAESPLSRAVLGRRVGESVDVRAPTGPYRAVILSADRTEGRPGPGGSRRAVR